jgi:hypothetical protein
MTEEFNGHTNWDTWNASLWLANEEFTYRECVSLASYSTSLGDLAQRIESFVESIELTGDGFDVNKVDWESIAEEYFEEDEEEEDEEE